ncbi:Peroxidasin homolog [Seminavis robusta]|uniref:Peroxidasin homolog n=1 Tax=Seminavis robusta TaxID=568900 RepID=A0A9N8E8Q8_9STRA|nr:Peroxidasin homolog [Seminavis robusta]|eukprot:Sro670_g184640.1 Peroxidasin homolog (853) ;mRNA; r:8680-11238
MKFRVTTAVILLLLFEGATKVHSEQEVLVGIEDAGECDPDAPPSYDGSCNNLKNPLKGAGYSADKNPNGILLRDVSMRGYIMDGENNYKEPRGDIDPRLVSDAILKTENVEFPVKHHANLMHTFFGQFISHDVVRTVFPNFELEEQSTLLDIQPDPDAPEFVHAVHIKPTDSTTSSGYREQRNGASSFLDLNHVYGLDSTVAALLREFKRGRLLASNVTKEFTWMPTNHRDFRLCDCVNTTDGTPWHLLKEDHSNVYDIHRESLRGFTPEPLDVEMRRQGIPQPCFSAASFCIPPKGRAFFPNPSCDVTPNLPVPLPMCNSSVTSEEDEDIILNQTDEGETPPLIPEAPFPGVAIPALVYDDCVEPARRLEEVMCMARTEPIYNKESKWVIPEGREWPPRGDEVPDPPFDAILAASRNLDEFFVGGDDRNIENAGIFVLHNMFFREHNYQAGLLEEAHPDWNDEQLFQEARRRVTAAYHKMVYDEWLPVVLGDKLHAAYNLSADAYNYDEDVDASTSNIMSTVALRFGHSTVPVELYMRDPKTHERIPLTKLQRPYKSVGPRVPIEDDFLSLPVSGQVGPFLSTEIFAYADGEDTVMAAMLFEHGYKVDEEVADSVRNVGLISSFLAKPFIVDVPVLNMRRGRNHGLPGYDTVRSAYHPTGSVFASSEGENNPDGGKCFAADDTGTPDPLECFMVFCRTQEIAETVQSIYGKVDHVDPWLGILLESGKEHVEGGILGPTAAHILAEQFVRTRDGDRFFYPEDLRSFAAETNLQALIQRHHGVQDVPENVFVPFANTDGNSNNNNNAPSPAVTIAPLPAVTGKGEESSVVGVIVTPTSHVIWVVFLLVLANLI